MNGRRALPGMKVIARWMTAALAGPIGCSSRPPVVLPAVPMEYLDAPSPMPGADTPTLPPGVCAAADSLPAMPGDTLDPVDLRSQPLLLSMPNVQYPVSERESGWEGDVPVRLLVRPDGRVGRVDVGDGRDPFLLAAARAGCGAQFSAGKTTSGDSAYVWITHTFSFRLGIAIPANAPRRK